jgi:hypothetical protein
LKMEMAAVFGFAQHLARFGQRSLRRLSGRFDRPFFSKKIELVPILPSLERLAGDFRRKTNAVSLIDV